MCAVQDEVERGGERTTLVGTPLLRRTEARPERDGRSLVGAHEHEAEEIERHERSQRRPPPLVRGDLLERPCHGVGEDIGADEPFEEEDRRLGVRSRLVPAEGDDLAGERERPGGVERQRRRHASAALPGSREVAARVVGGPHPVRRQHGGVDGFAGATAHDAELRPAQPDGALDVAAHERHCRAARSDRVPQPSKPHHQFVELLPLSGCVEERHPRESPTCRCGRQQRARDAVLAHRPRDPRTNSFVSVSVTLR